MRLLLVMALLVVGVAGCLGDVDPADDSDRVRAPIDGGVTLPGATITTPQGAMTIVLFPAIAPETVAQFQQLARAGFYNGSIFHRTVDNFVIQGGAPPPGYDEADTIPLEAGGHFAAGTLGIARNEAPDSGTSQFFIDEYPQPHLHEPDPLQSPTGFTYGAFTAFGQLVAGMDVVRAINDLPHDDSGTDRPRDPPPMRVVLHPVVLDEATAEELPHRTWGRQLALPYRVSLESPATLHADRPTWFRVYIEEQQDRGAETGVVPTVRITSGPLDEVPAGIETHAEDTNIHTVRTTFPGPGRYVVEVLDGLRPLARFDVNVA